MSYSYFHLMSLPYLKCIIYIISFYYCNDIIYIILFSCSISIIHITLILCIVGIIYITFIYCLEGIFFLISFSYPESINSHDIIFMSRKHNFSHDTLLYTIHIIYIAFLNYKSNLNNWRGKGEPLPKTSNTNLLSQLVLLWLCFVHPLMV
jgi:hypothetical protein